jgi:signal transduction histidine kinase
VFASLFFLTGMALAGIGVPIAVGIAILRFRLYDLDLVVKKTVVFGVLVILLLAVGLLLALVVGGSVVGLSTDSAPLIVGGILGLSVVPLSRLATRLADRVVYGGRATPYEVLTAFSDRVANTYSADDVLPRTAAVLGAGIGAQTVRVWLRLGDRLRLLASWPQDLRPVEGPTVPDDGLPTIDDEDPFEIRHQGELLGAISVTMPANDPMNPSKQRLIRDLASQAGLVLRNVRLIEELRESRLRIVVAQDERAKALERNIHDGAQQQLVALAVKLRLLEQLAERDPTKARTLAEELQAEANDTLENLRDLARGIYPPLLADKGLAAAVEAQARKAAVPTIVHSDGIGRYPEDVEAAAYFCVLEALNNVSKYADASAVDVVLAQTDGQLTLRVSDDGRGFDSTATSYGTGLQGIADRLSALGGDLTVESALGGGTTIRGSVPAEPR